MTTKHPTNGARVFNPSFFPLHHGRVKNPCSVLCAFILGVAFADTTLSQKN